MSNSESQARAQLASIVEMVERMRNAIDNDDESEIDEAASAIHNDALIVEVRSDWYDPCSRSSQASEYRILLCTGGPAVHITGDLDEHSRPKTARIEHQDWFTPWIELRPLDDEEIRCLMDYCEEFYFG